MKTSIKLIMAIFIIANTITPSFAQLSLKGHSGLYLSVNDYNTQKLSFEIDCTKESHKIKADKLFGQSKVDIIHDGKKYTYNKKDVFGFRDCNDRDFRFSNNKEYQILDGEFFILYQGTVYVSNGKTYSTKLAYFISKDAGAPITPLTMEKLKKLFPSNHKFHDLIDADFKSDDELARFDSFHQKFAIKHLYEQSLK